MGNRKRQSGRHDGDALRNFPIQAAAIGFFRFSRTRLGARSEWAPMAFQFSARRRRPQARNLLLGILLCLACAYINQCAWVGFGTGGPIAEGENAKGLEAEAEDGRFVLKWRGWKSYEKMKYDPFWLLSLI